MEQALYCLYAHPSKKSKARHLVDHGISNIAFTWDRCLKPYLYLRPKKLPEYDDLKSASVISETVVFFRRIWYVYNIFSYFSFLLLLKCSNSPKLLPPPVHWFLIDLGLKKEKNWSEDICTVLIKKNFPSLMI